MPRATHQRHAIAATIALSLVAMTAVSKVLGPRQVARSVATAPVPSAELSWRGIAAKGEPIELSLRADVRELCHSFALPPEPHVLESASGGDADAEALEGLARCVREGQLSGQALELLGPTELPGAIEHAVESAAPADAVRSQLARLGVPFGAMVTRDLPVDVHVSPHSALRVVIGVAPPSLQQEPASPDP